MNTPLTEYQIDWVARHGFDNLMSRGQMLTAMRSCVISGDYSEDDAHAILRAHNELMKNDRL